MAPVGIRRTQDGWCHRGVQSVEEPSPVVRCGTLPKVTTTRQEIFSQVRIGVQQNDQPHLPIDVFFVCLFVCASSLNIAHFIGNILLVIELLCNLHLTGILNLEIIVLKLIVPSRCTFPMY